MERAKNIETLSLCFTLGVALSSLLFSRADSLLPALLLPVVALPVLLHRRLLRLGEPSSVGVLLGTFLLLGLFCGRNAALPGPVPGEALREFAAGAGAQLRAFIGTLPFPSEGTAPLLSALLTGDRSALAPETVAAFRGSGASHLLALSGLHMGIVYLLLDACTKPLGGSRPARLVRFGLLLGAACLRSCHPDGRRRAVSGAGLPVYRAQ